MAKVQRIANFKGSFKILQNAKRIQGYYICGNSVTLNNWVLLRLNSFITTLNMGDIYEDIKDLTH